MALDQWFSFGSKSPRSPGAHLAISREILVVITGNTAVVI